MTETTKSAAAVALGKMRRGIKERPSERKAKTCRENGKLGGRPKRVKNAFIQPEKMAVKKSLGH